MTSLFMPLYPPLLVIAGVIQSFILPGLVIFLLLGRAKRPWTDTIFMIPLISPVLLTCAMLLAIQVTGDFQLSLRLSVGLFYLLFFILLLLRRDVLEVSESPVPRSAVLLSISYGLLIACAYAVNDLLLIRSDAWYHASVTSEILSRGIPPMEPWLPDRPIRYMWIYHLFLATWKRLSGLELFWAMGLFNVISAFSFPYLIARIIGTLIPGGRRIFWASLISIAGLESASWIATPIMFARTFVGEVKGSAEMSRIISNLRFDGPEMMHTLTPYTSAMVNLSDKFITITSFSYAFDLFLLAFVVYLSREYMKRSRAGSAILLFVLILGSFLFHVIIGAALICTVVGAGILLPLIERFITKKPSRLFPRIMPAAAALAAALVCLPYLASLGGTETGGESFLAQYLHFGTRNLITILLPLLILFYPARRAIRKILTFRGKEYVLLASWLIPLLALTLFADLPTGNEDKLIFPLFLLLGPAVSIEITGILQDSMGLRKKMLIAWTIFLFLVPPLLTFYAFLGYTAEEAGIERRAAAYRSDRKIFEAVSSRTGKCAIVAENGFSHLMPVFAQRRNLAGGMLLHYVYGYDEDYVTKQHELNEALFACEPLHEETVDLLAAGDYDLYVAIMNEDMKSCSFLVEKFEGGSDLFELIYAGEEGRVYLFKRPSQSLDPE